MSSDIRERYQAARQAIDGYRRTNFLFGLICGFIGSAALMIGALFGYAGIVALSLLLYLVAGSLLFFIVNIRHFDNVKPFLCKCEGYEYSAENDIRQAWVCGFCGQTHLTYNFQPWWRTLLERCKKCHRAQHSVLCCRCDKPIIWNERAYSYKTSAWYLDYPPQGRGLPVAEEGPS
jgi:hypothetical protein